VLLRPSSHKSTFVQMVGRGLRPVDPELYPGTRKEDCLVLDFGISTLTHGSLEQEASLGQGRLTAVNDAPKRECPSCQALVPANSFTCGFCGFALIVCDTLPDGSIQETLREFVLTEIEIFSESPFAWEPLWDGAVLVATAFDAWACIVNFNGQWHAIGQSKAEGVRLLSTGERLLCVAQADDFMRAHGDSDGARKSKRWLSLPVTDQQLRWLGLKTTEALGMTRYRAACHLSWHFNERAIKHKLNMRRAA
jgi:DNA repair protein RadD